MGNVNKSQLSRVIFYKNMQVLNQEVKKAESEDKAITKTKKDFSEDEKKIIVEEYAQKLCGPKFLSKKYNTSKKEIMSEKPEKTDNMSQEEYQKVLKNYFNQNNLKHRDDFSVEEKKEIVRECTVNLIGPKKL